MPENFCPQCGERLKSNARFCTACGTDLASRASDKAPSPPKEKASRSLPWPLLLLLAGGALLLLGLLLNQPDTPAPVADAPDEPDAALQDQASAGLPFPDVPRISVAEAQERLDSGAAVIVDVRRAASYAEAHIPDARSIPENELQSRYQELSPDAEIITYCT